jgi:hypothetical protein
VPFYIYYLGLRIFEDSTNVADANANDTTHAHATNAHAASFPDPPHDGAPTPQLLVSVDEHQMWQEHYDTDVDNTEDENVLVAVAGSTSNLRKQKKQNSLRLADNH